MQDVQVPRASINMRMASIKLNFAAYKRQRDQAWITTAKRYLEVHHTDRKNNLQNLFWDSITKRSLG